MPVAPNIATSIVPVVVWNGAESGNAMTPPLEKMLGFDELMVAVVSDSVAPPMFLYVTDSVATSTLSRYPSASQESVGALRVALWKTMKFSQSKLSTTPELLEEKRSGDTAVVPRPRLAKAAQKRAWSAGSPANAAARTASRASVKV